MNNNEPKTGNGKAEPYFGKEVVMSNGMELALFTPKMLEDVQPICDVFVKSGIFEDIKDVAQAIVKVLAGREIGLSPLESMMNLYIVKNRIAANSKVVSSLIKKSKGYDYSIEKLDNEECVIAFYKISGAGQKEELGKSTFMIKDAAKAGIVNKDNWKNYPRNMLFARAIANGARWFCPDVYCGYVEEELETIAVEPKKDVVTVDASGEVKTNG
jgi:hypothetical protein